MSSTAPPQVQVYRRMPVLVHAVKWVEPHHGMTIAAWVNANGGTASYADGTTSDFLTMSVTPPRVLFNAPDGIHVHWMGPGDWLVMEDKGKFLVYKDQAKFRAEYDQEAPPFPPAVRAEWTREIARMLRDATESPHHAAYLLAAELLDPTDREKS